MFCINVLFNTDVWIDSIFCHHRHIGIFFCLQFNSTVHNTIPRYVAGKSTFIQVVLYSNDNILESPLYIQIWLQKQCFSHLSFCFTQNICTADWANKALLWLPNVKCSRCTWNIVNSWPLRAAAQIKRTNPKKSPLAPPVAPGGNCSQLCMAVSWRLQRGMSCKCCWRMYRNGTADTPAAGRLCVTCDPKPDGGLGVRGGGWGGFFPSSQPAVVWVSLRTWGDRLLKTHAEFPGSLWPGPVCSDPFQH